MAESGITSVQVALRIRPLVENEIANGQKRILETVDGEPQVYVKESERSFTFNYVFDANVSQAQFYNCAVKNMVSSLFKGYNVTILAYGQTGSGKTHTMGTSYVGDDIEQMGIIQRAVKDIFEAIDLDVDNNFQISVSFMELYQELLYDLLADKTRDQCVVDIREDVRGGIIVPGLTECTVTSATETIACLTKGSLGRATGATAMNAQSSRSHAIFTICIEKQSKNDSNVATTAKFHLVDLAGSERPKKTKATGERFKEGININKGLLALGNVISALGEGNHSYVSYRDSKLTRLLQDSLGGNSITLMIACVSPAAYNLDETVSTLRYADRARKIKNKPIINQDPRVAEIARLHQQLRELQLITLEQGNSTSVNEELHRLRQENEQLLGSNEMLRIKNRKLTEQLHSAISENACMLERSLITETAHDKLQKKLSELNEEYSTLITNTQLTEEQSSAYKEIQNKIEDLRKDHHIFQTEVVDHDVHSAINNAPPDVISDVTPLFNKTHLSVINEANEQMTNEYQEKHVQQQLEYSKQLQALACELAIKERLASEIEANTRKAQLIDINSLQENEQKITALEKEKEELLQQLKQTQTKEITSKLAEQRRQRVNELESQISELNKKVRELSHLIKLREKDEQKIKQLNNEIMSMKQAKVKLVKMMRSESDKFKQWKIQREREMSKLREQDRKRKNEMIKMENMHAKQQTVLKRKVEEAAAINKRLKDALALQKTVQNRRAANGKVERVQSWVLQEFEILVSTAEAERTLKSLIEEKKLILQEKDELEKQLNENDGETEEVIQEKRNRMKEILEDIELRDAQISDMRQKIQDSDQENKSKTRWDAIQSMVDAKCALKCLFEITADYKKELLAKDCEQRDKINALLDKVHSLTAELNLKCIELEQLKMRTPAPPPPKIGQKRRRSKIHEACIDEDDEEDPFLDYDSDQDVKLDDSKDPDWQKTPVVQRITSKRQTMRIKPHNLTENTSNPMDSTVPLKRSSNGTIKCTCTTRCETKRCSCRKFSNYCSSNCKCNNDCVNRNNDSSNNMETDSPLNGVSSTGIEENKENENSLNGTDNSLSDNDGNKTFVKRPKKYFS
ncbi:chromosome-associated kinesin KIF4-like [Chrysoperla carnea]|uniref:chromosome-associated kinesin KIF4-like n=1 Tax=Chrysoperla carnea TaxID=189513 RepID=UPI001D094766|nr:chromosome-associated kinesin KIF4-like [Chrysoperla carnea]